MGVCCPISPQAAPGHAPTPPGPGVVFLGLPGPGLASARHPPQPGRLLVESAAPPPAGRRLALASAQTAAAAGGHRPGRRALGALAQLLRRAPAPHVSLRDRAENREGAWPIAKGGVCGKGRIPRAEGRSRGWIDWARRFLGAERGIRTECEGWGLKRLSAKKEAELGRVGVDSEGMESLVPIPSAQFSFLLDGSTGGRILTTNSWERGRDI